MDRNSHKSGPWLGLLDGMSWSDAGRHDGPRLPSLGKALSAWGGSLLLTMELEHPGAVHRAFIPISSLCSLLSPGSSTSSALSRCLQALPVLSCPPGRPLHPPFQSPHHQLSPCSSSVLIEPLLLLPRLLGPASSIALSALIALCYSVFSIEAPAPRWLLAQPVPPTLAPWHGTA